MFNKIRSIIITISAFVTLAVFAPFYIAALVIFGPRKSFRLRQWYGLILIWSTGCLLEVCGKKPARNCTYIFVANHSSMYDALIIAAAIPQNFSVIAKKELLKIPIFGSIVKRMGFMFIDRKNRAEAGMSIPQSIAKLISKISVFVFPQGTRTKDGGIGRFKPGAFVIARRTGTPILPMGICGSFEANPTGWNFFPRKLTVTFGEPIEPEEYAGLSIDQLSDLVKERIIELSNPKQP